MFFFISLLSVSSSLLLLPAIDGKAELSAACTLDFLEGIEKSCTSLRSMAPELEADFSISVIFILGRLLCRVDDERVNICELDSIGRAVSGY